MADHDIFVLIPMDKAWSKEARAAAQAARKAKSQGKDPHAAAEKAKEAVRGGASVESAVASSTKSGRLTEAEGRARSGPGKNLTKEQHLERMKRAGEKNQALAKEKRPEHLKTDEQHIKEIDGMHETGGFDDGTAHSVKKVDKVEAGGLGSPNKEFKPREGDKFVEVHIYDEGKAEGGESYYAINDGKVRHVGNSGSGPWGIPPGPEGLRGKAEMPTKEFVREVKAEAAHWKKYWKEEMDRNG